MMRSAAVVGVCTGLSRVLGLVRNMLMARLFGTSLVQSAFVVAFRFPNLFRRLFGEGAMSAAFVPVFARILEREGRDAAWRFAASIMTLLVAVLAAVVIVVTGGASALLRFAPLGERMNAVLSLLRIMFPYMLFICLVALCMAVLNSFHHFLVPAATPILLNVVWILALVAVCPRLGTTPGERIHGVAWAVLIAGALQLTVQLPFLVRFGYRFQLTFDWRGPEVQRVLRLMGPAALGMGVFQVNVMIDSVLAMVVGKWAPAALSFAELLVYLPLSVVATAMGTVLLPVFSRQAAQSRPDAIRDTLVRSLQMICLVLVPAATGLMVFSRPIVQLLYEWSDGEFDAVSTVRTARALAFYAPGLVVFGVYKVLAPAFYAREDTRTPVRVAVKMVGVNLVLNIVFMLTWPGEFKHAGLAFATVISSALNCFVLGRILSARWGPIGWRKIAGSAARCALAAGVMAIACACLHAFLVNRCALEWMGAKGAQLVSLMASIAAGLLVYAGMAGLVCRRETTALLSGWTRR